jgi:hypothetical protein
MTEETRKAVRMWFSGLIIGLLLGFLFGGFYN